jgi:hypothetical protein
MSINLKRRLLRILLVSSYVLLSYIPVFGWWYSSIGTFFIVLFSYFLWDKNFLDRIGLLLDVKTIAKSVVLAGIVTVCALLVMRYIAARYHVQIRFTNWREYVHDVFYVLNEEIVIGAIVLFTLVNKRKVQPIIASFGLAIFFSLIHFVFYKWIFKDRGNIGMMTLLTLFFVGFVRNSLILQTGHIGYSWALHFGWMVVMFGSWHVIPEKNLSLGELTRFNTYLGSKEMLTISSVLAILSLIYWKRKEFKNG